MKKYISRILAGMIIAAALIAGNFAGMGAAEVKAADEQEMLNIRIVDKNKQPVQGVQLVLKNDKMGELEFSDVTDKDGEASFDPLDYYDEMTEAATYFIDVVAGSSCSFEKSIEVGFCMSEQGWGAPYFDSVGGNPYDGDYVELTVITSGGGQTTTPIIKSVTSSASQIEWGGGFVTINIEGTALPENMYYSLWYQYNAQNENSVRIVGANNQLVKTTVTSTGRKFTMNLPDASNYPSAVAWKISVSLNTKEIGSYTKGITINPDVVTDKIKTALNSAIAGMSQLKEADYTANSWKAYSDAVEAGKALLEKEDATGTEYRRATDAIERAKSALVRVRIPVQEIKVSKLTITGMSKKIAAGKKIQLTAKASPADASDKTVKWTSSNKKYAVVDAKGKVTAKKAGEGKTVTITATATDGSGVKATYKIKIIKNAVKSVRLKAKNSVKAGKSLTVKATVKTTGKNANKTLKWTSSNTKYATVSSKGVVKTKKAGKGKTVKITAKATDGSGKKKTITIKIK